MLPFLKESKWPRMAKISGESKYGFSEDDELMEDATKELMRGIETKEISAIINAIEALVEIIKSKHVGEADDVLKDT